MDSDKCRAIVANPRSRIMVRAKLGQPQHVRAPEQVGKPRRVRDRERIYRFCAQPLAQFFQQSVTIAPRLRERRQLHGQC